MRLSINKSFVYVTLEYLSTCLFSGIIFYSLIIFWKTIKEERKLYNILIGHETKLILSEVFEFCFAQLRRIKQWNKL